ncbi:MAG: uracil-DNA glycosylase [Syntrophales bacterium]|jgi:DNA polymerase|nr:uracil-DNA glycosylase [Syntrophales bacterium]MCK9527440.1 uracil-DNA glycosylase [Syntrophales bacterium]MDX9921544.1 uracil-DNA glycosylase [Syntrophales bacterium]
MRPYGNGAPDVPPRTSFHEEELLELARSLRVRLAECLLKEDVGGLTLSGRRYRLPAATAGDERENRGVHPGRSLEEIRTDLGDCRRCGLYKTRRNIVFGEGNPRAPLVFVGEAPGADEDRQGRPFTGRAGRLLTRIIEAMGMKREDIYICNILKCRPPENRNPGPDEISACEPFLKRQIDAIQPRVICALGTFAAKTLLGKDAPITVLRGTFHEYRGTPLMPTYHPAYLLRNQGAKRKVWEDMQMIMNLLSFPAES